jgi:AraC-like DNA-binding protein
MSDAAIAHAPPARHLLRARDLADARYFEPLDVGDMAHAAGLSRAHFSREFRKTFGESPHAYLLTRRLERACVERFYGRPEHRTFREDDGAGRA